MDGPLEPVDWGKNDRAEMERCPSSALGEAARHVTSNYIDSLIIFIFSFWTELHRPTYHFHSSHYTLTSRFGVGTNSIPFRPRGLVSRFQWRR